MKKIFVLSVMLSAAILALQPVSVLAAPVGPQEIRRQDRDRNDQRNNGRRRTVTTTRIVHEGRFRYRETIRTTYLPNGRTRTQVISRVRIR